MAEADVQRLADDVGQALAATVDEVVPWFVAQMPDAYFHDLDEATRRQHLAALVGAKATGISPQVTLRSADGVTWTAIRPADRPGLLAEVLDELPDGPLHAAKVYTARDRSLVLDVFSFGAPRRVDLSEPEARAKVEATRAWAAAHDPGLPLSALDDYLSRCAEVFVENLSPRRLAGFARLAHEVAGSDDVAVSAWPHPERPELTTITLAAGRVRPRRYFQRAASLLGHHGVSVRRAYLDPIGEGEPSLVLATFVVEGADGVPFPPDGPAWEGLRTDLRRITWLDDRVLDAASEHPKLGLARAEVLVALLDLVHVRLSRRDPFAFSRDRIAQLVSTRIDLAASLCDDLIETQQEGRAALEVARLTEDVRVVLEEIAWAVGAARQTNLGRPGRYGLVIDLDPSFLLRTGDTGEHESVPYGVIYGHGIGYRGFHVRFAEIARGGLRAVTPRAVDQHTLETERLFDEVYGLAYAQQLKNKDIPEGGAKGVVLVHPDGDVETAVRGFADGLLDVATGEPPQLLYLGPDENITPSRIEWIAQRAAVRGYPQPLAFMSSKPGAGINHKEYGVTSEGVAVFLDVALTASGRAHDQAPFTVKLTGGPDGDVAGNMIRILQRDHGARARVVGIADGSGCAEDPDGLDHAELMRLVNAELPIASFAEEHLGPRGRVVPLDAPEGISLRNTMAFRVPADVFVPAGGRPRTIHEGNWRQFLLSDGTPSSPIIVEGANLFLTPGAREALSQRGVWIVKDSSANKCGVICSSFEIAASMVLTEEAFLAVKEPYVREVLQRLRTLARREAELLFRTLRRHPDIHLPDLSVRLSRVILRTTEAIARALIGLDPDAYELLETLVDEHLPVTLREATSGRLLDALPPAYVEQTIACAAATRIVYREGLDYLEGLQGDELAAFAVRYLGHDREVSALLGALGDADAAARVGALLTAGGARAAMALDDAER